MRRVVLVGVGVLVTLAGVIFTLQGVGVLGGSVMSGVTFWAVAGPVIALAGLAIAAIGLHGGLASQARRLCLRFDILGRPEGGDSSRDLWSRCRFAVHRPGIPEASPRSHGMPCRGSVLDGAGARLVLADTFKISLRSDIRGEVERRFLPGLEARVSTPQSR